MAGRSSTLFAAAGVILLCPASRGQGAVPADPFIATVEAMKRSIARLVCLPETGGATPAPRGSAFFISAAGEFLTAAHVIEDMRQGQRPCPVAAIMIPVDEQWHPEAPDETQVWFPFAPSGCALEPDLDVARCTAGEDLSVPKRGLRFRIMPVAFAWNVPPDGAQVAFTGFPLGNRDPVTARGAVATHRAVLENGKPTPELVLDRPAWPVSSGSPVYLADGSVVGILIRGGADEGAGMTIVRPAASIQALLAERGKQ